MLTDLTSASPTGEATFRDFLLVDVNPLGGRTKRRRISAPNPAMKAVHKRLIKYLRGLPVDLSAATGARKGHSPITNIIPHRHNRYFLLLDIKNAYETVDLDRLIEVFLGLDPDIPRDSLFGSELLKNFLGAFCFAETGGLRTGAPASPDLYNIYLAVLLDYDLSELCRKYGLTYTRYLDDITLSSKTVIGTRKRKAILSLIRSAGLVIHDSKTQLLDLKRGSVKITGFTLTSDRRIILPRSYLGKIRGFLHKAISQELFDLKTWRLVNGMVAQLRTSLQYPSIRPTGDRRRWRLPNASERKVLNQHHVYKSLYRAATDPSRPP